MGMGEQQAGTGEGGGEGLGRQRGGWVVVVPDCRVGSGGGERGCRMGVGEGLGVDEAEVGRWGSWGS